ncbi:LysR family transcriptional regulator [Streptomyces sp. ST2-7A]|uniref:LysR family transcriptional regulator n=1 Tax=Streptomyces sp. ST2-7A TaxID=2907214 RepID=UPI001F194B9C|nr:LysR family transcriptional regulator [Streptomyces sp. ST2-7A]MCE7078962.1 LysR family transcriptional regulator [Streptomyces sp. ST2-7A]
MMDVRRLRTLRTVVATGSITAAATELGYTPSAVSQQIAALEREAGSRLLERIGRGVRPTAAGRLLAEHAVAVEERVLEAAEALADLRAGRTGRLTLHHFASAGTTLVVPALLRMRRDHPRMRVVPEPADPTDPTAALDTGAADLVLTVRPEHVPPRPGTRVVLLRRDPYRVVLPVDHPRAREPTVSPADLADEPWVCAEPPGPCLDPILDACATAGFRPDLAVRAEDHATAQGFVAAGLGPAVMPLLALRHRHPGVVVRPVRGPEPVRAISAVVRDSDGEHPALRSLLAALRAEAAAGVPGTEPDAGGGVGEPATTTVEAG